MCGNLPAICPSGKVCSAGYEADRGCWSDKVCQQEGSFRQDHQSCRESDEEKVNRLLYIIVA